MTMTASFNLFGLTITKQDEERKSRAMCWAIDVALNNLVNALRPDDAVQTMHECGLASEEGQAEGDALAKRCQEWGITVEFLVEFDNPEDFDSPSLLFAPSVKAAAELLRDHAAHNARFEGVRLSREEEGMNVDSLNVAYNEGTGWPTYALWMQRGGNYIVTTPFEHWQQFIAAVEKDYMEAIVDGLV